MSPTGADHDQWDKPQDKIHTFVLSYCKQNQPQGAGKGIYNGAVGLNGPALSLPLMSKHVQTVK